MKHEQFNEIAQARVNNQLFQLTKKSKEYASDSDRLHNFRLQAAFLGCSEERALLGNMSKHLASLIDLVGKGETPSEAMVSEKLGDIINYCILLEAIWVEKREKQ